MLNKLLFKQIDNSALIVFRVIFGLLCFLESFGAIVTGWVKRTLIEPDFTFNFIGFEFLQPLPGNGMYYYYAIMGLFGLLIMLGFKYRFSMFVFTVMWSATYLMQKCSYNNHYYLLMLLSGLMLLLPAHKYASLDVKLRPEIKSYAMPRWCRWIIILQLFIVYTYASSVKIYPDWLDGSVMELFMKSKRNYLIVGDLLQQKWMHYMLAYGGILFDGLIIPSLLFKPTRKYAFVISIFFHLFNSVVFQIGIFPYLSLAFSLFFFPAKKIRNIFLKNKPFYTSTCIEVPKFKGVLVGGLALYFIIQIGLPLRHYFIEGDVLRTEEGHRLSWRMMLRSKIGRTTYWVENKATGKRTRVDLSAYLSKKQQHAVRVKPDLMWQFSQRLKKQFKEKGQDIAVYIDSKISINGKPYTYFISKEVDIANVKWDIFKHSDWILPLKAE